MCLVLLISAIKGKLLTFLIEVLQLMVPLVGLCCFNFTVEKSKMFSLSKSFLILWLRWPWCLDFSTSNTEWSIPSVPRILRDLLEISCTFKLSLHSKELKIFCASNPSSGPVISVIRYKEHNLEISCDYIYITIY